MSETRAGLLGGQSCSFDVQLQHHLLWVWPDAGPNAHLEAMSKEAAVIPELLDEETAVYAVPWYMLSPPCTTPPTRWPQVFSVRYTQDLLASLQPLRFVIDYDAWTLRLLLHLHVATLCA